MLIDVERIDDAAAEELLDCTVGAPGAPRADQDVARQRLIDGYVRVWIDVDVRFEDAGSDVPAAYVLTLPAAGERSWRKAR